MSTLLAGHDYPGSMGEFLAWFSTDEACRDYLAWLRWPSGFTYDRCGHEDGWRIADGRWKCSSCSHRTSVTAGTIFDRTRTPLTVWFQAVWAFATPKDGVSALGLQRTLEFGSYQTAWAILHRLRSVLTRPDRELLHGIVEVDETYIGGEEPGLSGGRARGKKALVAVAVEEHEPRGYGRCRMETIEDASRATLHRFIRENIAPGSRVITDGWGSYRGLDLIGYIHEPRNQNAARARGEDVGTLLPGVHRVASLAKRWLLSTHQGAVDRAHLDEYLGEFCFRFNRRTSNSRGLLFYRVLELAVGHSPVRYKDLARGTRSRSVSPIPPRTTGHPPSIERATGEWPWRSR
ncbi:MAG: IS1595 family transposase [Candidatus Leucobacter sulfamidivorax]|nr:IS1595 family transposase [Candidatus Leucobacter sulfamidivorax]